MILHKLCEYYDRIVDDPNQEIAAPGFAPQNVGFEVLLNEDGTLHSLQDIRDSSGKKPTNQVYELPYSGKRANGIAAMFLWDKPEYLLGWVPTELATTPNNESEQEAKKRGTKIDRISECFEASKILHSEIAEKIHSSEFQCVKRFFDYWKPTFLTSEHQEFLANIGTGFGVFRVVAYKNYLHQIPEVRDFWMANQGATSDSDIEGTCLISGRSATLARLHPAIKGVRDAQSSGASIVSFNDDAFTSYGKKQSYNAPVGQESAFKYATSLNRLLERDSSRKLQVGDTTCVYWSDTPSQAEDLFGFSLNSDQFEDESRANEIGNSLKRLASGEADFPDSDVGFNVLGLSPNASRLSIRFWISGTVSEILGKALAHQTRMEIVRSPKDQPWLPLWLILAQTARETKEVQPLLGGAILRSILTGGRYPESLLSAVLRRIRADRVINYPRAAIIKAVLCHNFNKDITTMLNPNRTEASYQLGRLFAALEKCQEDALPGLNATIKDRYFGAASSTPASVFPRLIRMSQHHIGKLEGGKKINAEKRSQEIVGHIETFPSHFGLVDQGLFAIGYYHQRQSFFTKKDPEQAELQSVK